MADKIFNVKILQNVETEARWLVSSYAIKPKEQVFAIVTKTVTENGTSKTINYIRSKVNTTNESKTFAELEYSDEYITLNLSAISDELTETTMTANMNKALIGQVKTELEQKIEQSLTSIYKPMGSILQISQLPGPSETTLGEVYNVVQGFTTTDEFLEGAGVTIPENSNVAIVSDGTGLYKYDVIGSVVDLTNYYDKEQTKDEIDSAIDLKLVGIDLNQIDVNKENVETLQTTVSGLNSDVLGMESDVNTLKTDMSQAKTNITNLQSDVNTAVTQVEDMQTAVNGLESDVSNLESSLNSKIGANSPALTGTPTAPTATKGTNTTQIATTAFVQTALSDAGGGNTVTLSATAPTGGKQGDLWFKILS